jgi:histidyl-tRNA synthetase
MRDIAGMAFAHASGVADALRASLTAKGYDSIDTPLLEETELFVRKSGGEISGRLYTFTDPGGHKVSLRPEFTPSIIRHYVQEQDSLAVPVKWQYGGPVFRYEAGNSKGYRQFTQVGAEIIGDGGVAGDAAIISDACDGLDALGISHYQVRLGHIGVLLGLLDSYGLSDSAKHLIISQVQALKSGQTNVSELRERADDMGLLRARNGGSTSGQPYQEINSESAQVFILNVLRDSVAAPVGSRSPEQIAERLLRKATDATDPRVFENALDLVNELAQLDGKPGVVIAEAERILSSRGLEVDPLADLRRLFDIIDEGGSASAHFVLDLGLARGISYYTGVIFELMHDNSTRGETSLGGGGRYDGLVKSLGGQGDVPALGFAYYIDQIIEALEIAQADF